jgi:ferredoxin
MQYRLLAKKVLRPKLSKLLDKTEFWGVVSKGWPASEISTGPKFTFQKIQNTDELVLEYDSTILPPKKILYPPIDELLKYQVGQKYTETFPKPNKEIVIFGLHAYDIVGINILDQYLLQVNGNPDPYFSARREKSLLIGIEHLTNEWNFSKDMGTSQIESGFDWFIYGLDQNNYIIAIGSPKGASLADELGIKKIAGDKEIKKLAENRKKADALIDKKLKMSNQEIPALLEGTPESPVWDAIGNRCFSCGSCNLVCPTCYCFDVRDIPEGNLKEGARCRFWDGCMLRTFAVVAGNENFRPQPKHRLKHRFYRKGWFLKDKLNGRLACVGCGRCSQVCKADISISKTFNDLAEDFHGNCQAK